MTFPPPNPNQLINDTMDRLGEWAKRRNPRLKRLIRIEQMVRNHAPLPCTYDASRTQPPYFNEFCYTELLGGILLTPQSSQAQAQLVDIALHDSNTYASCFIEPCDKYALNSVKKNYPTHVIFPPGSNCFIRFVSKENLSRLMFEDETVVIKPHPLTDEGLLRLLGREFGYHRILKPEDSGMDYLLHAEEVWVAPTTEMGLYAVLLEKPIHNIGSFFLEATAAFNAFYRVLWKLSVLERKKTLIRILSHPLSGWLHPDDNKLEEKLNIYFAEAMKIREKNKMLVHEYSVTQYQGSIAELAKTVHRREKKDVEEKDD